MAESCIIFMSFPHSLQYVLQPLQARPVLSKGMYNYNLTWLVLGPELRIARWSQLQLSINIGVAALSRLDCVEISTLRFTSLPNTVGFTVNDTRSKVAELGANVLLLCEVDPPAKALINGSGLGQVKEIQSNTSVLELVLEDLQCEDSGRYFCMEDKDKTKAYNSVDVNIGCVLKVRHPSPDIPTIYTTRDQNTVFTLEVYGYPEPNKFGLKIESGNSFTDVDKSTYSISYLSLVPPFGVVTVTLYDKMTKAVTTYLLTMENTEGKLDVKFEVINQDVENTTDMSTFWIKFGVGIGCSVLGIAMVIGLVVLYVRWYKRRSRQSDGKTSSVLNTTAGDYGERRTIRSASFSTN
ncbi:uncharacterized protein LOC131949259 [Physella acuta]|uniref:uncharacterized protein LOC131949259 n=1 Tax=Physella acuta TaxID=109671 RepID=UPI0027DD4088|nr:uncharacterized protein LOC131949259 [Physella acuta]